MTRAQVVAAVRGANPKARADDVSMYADCYIDYIEAQENIARNGNIVAHPRTGQPIENPYIKVKLGAMNQLRKFTSLRAVPELWGGDA